MKRITATLGMVVIVTNNIKVIYLHEQAILIVDLTSIQNMQCQNGLGALPQ